MIGPPTRGSLTAAALGALLTLRAGGALEEPARERKPAAPGGQVEVPPEHRGAAAPFESSETASEVRRAEEHIASGDWARGLAVLDEVLAAATGPGRPRKLRAPPETKERAGPEEAAAGPRRIAIFRGDVPVLPEDEASDQEAEAEIGPGEELVSADGVELAPVAVWARRRLVSLSAEARELYARTYEAPARAALERARGLAGAAALVELRRAADRYPLARAGWEAREALGDRLLDAGRAAEAARAYETRLELPVQDPASRAALLARAAAAHLLAGAPRSAGRALETIARDHPETPVLVRGEAVPGHALAAHAFFHALERRAAEVAAGAPPGGAWVGPRGTQDGAELPLEAASLPAAGSQALWIVPLAPGGGAHAGGAPSGGRPAGRGASIGDTVFARRGAEVIALDAHTGKLRWRAEPRELARGAARLQGFAALPSPAAAAAASSSAVFPASRPGEAALAVVLEDEVHSGQTETGKVVYRANRLVAYDARTGKVAWTAPGGADGGPGRRLAFTAPPVAAGGLLVAPAMRGESFCAAGVTRGGKVAWTRRLYSLGHAQTDRFGRLVAQGVPLASSDGIVAVASGHGIVAALDGASGEVLWASRYRSRIRQGYAPPRWQAGGPVIAGGLLIAAPVDSDHLVAFDLRTGRLLWERRFAGEGPQLLLGAGGAHAYIGGDEVLALRLDDGKDAWRSAAVAETARRPRGEADGDGEQVGEVEVLEAPAAGIDSAIVAGGRIVAAARDGTLAVLDARDGSVLERVRVLDDRMPRAEPMHLLLAAGQLLAVTPGRIFAVEPQAASWKDLEGGPEGNLRLRARLLEAEGRHPEAIAALEALRGKVRSRALGDEVDRELVEVSRAAAKATGDPRFVADLLARPRPLVKDAADVLSLRLLEAQLRERAGAGGLEAAARLYAELARKDGVTARSPEGFEVDAGAYASDALRELRARGVAVPAGDEGAGPPAKAEELPPSRASFVVLRRPQRDEIAAVELRIADLAEEEGDPARAAELLDLLADDFPARAAEPDVRARRERLSALPPDEPEAEGLAATIDGVGADRLARVFWAPAEDGFLASSAPGSAPLPALFAISGGRLRAYGREGKPVFERELPEYPDVAETKTLLQAHVEEPAVAHRRGELILLGTAAGLYAFRSPGHSGGVKGLRLAWTRPSRHPLLEMSSARSGWWWGGMPIPEGQNFFSEFDLDREDPLVLLRDGTLEALSRSTGKLRGRWKAEQGLPASPPARHGTCLQVRTASPSGLWILRASGGGRKAACFVRGPSGAAGEALLAAGGLAAAFGGEALQVVEASSGRALWTAKGARLALAFARGAELWLAEPDGRLVARSARSGRARRAVALPEGCGVTAVFLERDGSRTLVLSRAGGAVPGAWYGGRVRTGVGLHLLRLSAAGEKLWERTLHEGPVTCRRERLLVPGGRWVLAFNAEEGEEKWYTRVVVVSPADGSVHELCSLEVHGKGTGQPPRLQVLEGGLAVGNADGFGWFAPGPEGSEKEK
ncbi:MAG: PQQ-like beta-propeller repeat protein [Planctomycetes bacterium]|nr:PQQ-like beta-propeller repeat protein [Planctomycetota bacterium]